MRSASYHKCSSGSIAAMSFKCVHLSHLANALIQCDLVVSAYFSYFIPFFSVLVPHNPGAASALLYQLSHTGPWKDEFSILERKRHVTEKTHSCAATSTLSPWHTICYFKMCLSCLSGLSLTIETWTHFLYVCVFQGMYVFMHAVKGTPFETPDQGKARLLTHWEQLDYGVQFTSSRKFFTISPIILYVAFRHLG
jgi:hypothetical protein